MRAEVIFFASIVVFLLPLRRARDVFLSYNSSLPVVANVRTGSTDTAIQHVDDVRFWDR